MKTLLWKDYRLNRLLLIFGLVACVGPWVIAIVHNIYLELRAEEVWWGPWFWLNTASISLGLSLFTFAMLGGNAIAAERSDRSAEFLAYMPISRLSVLGSKSVIALSAAAIIWLVNLIILFIIAPRVATATFVADAINTRELREMLTIMGATSVLLLGTGWFWSTVLRSHGLATGMSAVALAAVVMGMIGIEYGLGVEGFLTNQTLATLFLVVGIGGFVAGCLTYLYRVEP